MLSPVFLLCLIGVVMSVLSSIVAVFSSVFSNRAVVHVYSGPLGLPDAWEQGCLDDTVLLCAERMAVVYEAGDSAALVRAAEAYHAACVRAACGRSWWVAPVAE